jgi:NAD(P)-dependent dehydrogenase (short-subunit alcohol dehydrogenase family)
MKVLPMNLHILPFVRAIQSVFALAVLTSAIAVSTIAAQETEDVRAVLVTGTSSGIGLRMTEVLSENGFFVYAGARKAEDLERLDAMENVKSVRLDVTIQSDIDAAVALVRAEGRGLYGLINNAGVSVMGPLIELSEEDMDFQLDVNLFGPYRVTKAFADLIIESEGRIMTVSSIAGILSGPLGGPYSMSKHGVEAYTDALAAELARFNVAVAAVEPGNYKSQILASMVQRMEETGYSAEGSRYGSMLDQISGPLDRSQYKEPDDVALAALDFLSSDSPKRRYMVVPNQYEAEITIRQAIQELVQLNDGHDFSYSREELIEMLDEALAEEQRAASRSTQTPSSVSLHQAALEGNLVVVRQHVEAGANLDEKDSYGSTPLIIAATFGHTEVAKQLIEAGADLDQQNGEGATALFTAALFCRTEIVEALLEQGADKSIRNNTGSTALEVVTPPWDAMKEIYDYLRTMLEPFGLELDYERIKMTRPKIAELLR